MYFFALYIKTHGEYRLLVKIIYTMCFFNQVYREVNMGLNLLLQEFQNEFTYFSISRTLETSELVLQLLQLFRNLSLFRFLFSTLLLW